jgi:hypothetical protein
MSTEEQPGQPSEEELRAAYEAEIKKVRVEHVLLDHIVTMVNLGRRRTGLAPGTEDERDVEQVRVAIESVRSVLPLLEQSMPEQIGPIRDAISQLQLAYVKIGGEAGGTPAPPPGEGSPSGGEAAGPPAPGGAGEPAAPKPGEPGPAQRSGRLWIPGT